MLVSNGVVVTWFFFVSKAKVSNNPNGESLFFLNDKNQEAETEIKNAEQKYSLCEAQYNYMQNCTRRIQQDDKTNREGNGMEGYRRLRSVFELIVERPNRCKIDLTLHFLRMQAQDVAEKHFLLRVGGLHRFIRYLHRKILNFYFPESTKNESTV